ncbi:enhancer of polycomb-like protein [Cystoisospora suis]|uniref:Enhancer of polycomb-like protein n=1 Tax=Cystoisospora suis TaxID=483139 RepID=A0A2C6LD03_9APIC|nr:enhancer of polycomb-like protein [Cystoisospora suis]
MAPPSPSRTASSCTSFQSSAVVCTTTSSVFAPPSLSSLSSSNNSTESNRYPSSASLSSSSSSPPSTTHQTSPLANGSKGIVGKTPTILSGKGGSQEGMPGNKLFSAPGASSSLPTSSSAVLPSASSSSSSSSGSSSSSPPPLPTHSTVPTTAAAAAAPVPQRQLRTRPVDAAKKLLVIRRYEDVEQLAEEEGVRIDPIQLGFLSPTEFIDEEFSAASTSASSGHGGGAGGGSKKKKQKRIVVPPIHIETSHDAQLKNFIRPDHYIRFELHRDQPTGLRLSDGTIVHYDMLREDEIFVENLNRRVALYAPPSLLTSPDLFTLPSDEDEEFSRKLQDGGDDNNLETKTRHDSSGKTSSLPNGKGEGGSQPEGVDVSGSVSGSLQTGGVGGSEREKDHRGHSQFPNDNKREKSDMSTSSSSDSDKKGIDNVNHKRQDYHGSPSYGSDTRNEGGGAVGEGEGQEAESLPVCNGVNTSSGSSSSSGRSIVGMPGGGGKLMRKDLVLSETAFVKLIDAFEKETHAKGGNENSLTHKEAIKIARENLKLDLHSVLVKQVQAYWIEKRQKLGKPLLRHFWPACSPSDVSPLAVFRPRQVGREKMTLRKQKRVGKDTLLRAERLLEDIKVVERLLRRMRCRDEKKEQLLEVQHLIFDQTRFELSDPLYRHPLWDSFREKVTKASDRQSTRKRHRTSSERRSRMVKKNEEEESAAAQGTNSLRRTTETKSAGPSASSSSATCTSEVNSGPSSLASSRQPSSEPGGQAAVKTSSRSHSSHSRRREKAGQSTATGDEQGGGEPTGRFVGEEEGLDGGVQGSGGEGFEEEKERTDQDALAVAMKDVDRILGDDAPPWVAWFHKENPHFRSSSSSSYFPSVSTFPYLTSFSSTSPAPPSLVPPPPPFLNSPSAESPSSSPFTFCRLVRRRGRGGRLWLDRLVRRPLISSSSPPPLGYSPYLSSRRSRLSPFAKASPPLVKENDQDYRNSQGADNDDEETGSQQRGHSLLLHGSGGHSGSATSNSTGDPLLSPHVHVKSDTGEQQTLMMMSSTSGSSSRRDEPNDVSSKRTSGPGVEGDKGAGRKKHGSDTKKNGLCEGGERQFSSYDSRRLSGANGRAHNGESSWQGGVSARRMMMAAWPPQQGLYIQPRRDEEGGGTDCYAPPFATAEGVDAPETTEGLQVFSIHRQAVQQERIAAAAASFAASTTIPEPSSSFSSSPSHCSTFLQAPSHVTSSSSRPLLLTGPPMDAQSSASVVPQHPSQAGFSSLEALHPSQMNTQAGGFHSLSPHPSFHIAATPSLLPASSGSVAPPQASYYGMSIHPAHALPPGSLAPQFVTRGGGIGAASSSLVVDAQNPQGGHIYFQGTAGEGPGVVSHPSLSPAPNRQHTVQAFYARPGVSSSSSVPHSGGGGTGGGDTQQGGGGLPSSFSSAGGSSEGVVRVSSLGSGGGSAYSSQPPGGGTVPHASSVYTPQRTVLPGTPDGRGDPSVTGGSSGGGGAGNVHESGPGSYKIPRAGDPGTGGAGSNENAAAVGQNNTGVMFSSRTLNDSLPGVVGGPAGSAAGGGATGSALHSPAGVYTTGAPPRLVGSGTPNENPSVLLTSGPSLNSSTAIAGGGTSTPLLVGGGGGEEYRQQLALQQQALQQQAGYFYYSCYGGAPVAPPSQQPPGHPPAPGGGGVQAYAYPPPNFPYQRPGGVSGSNSHGDQSAGSISGAPPPGEDANAAASRTGRQSGYNNFKVAPKSSGGGGGGGAVPSGAGRESVANSSAPPSPHPSSVDPNGMSASSPGAALPGGPPHGYASSPYAPSFPPSSHPHPCSPPPPSAPGQVGGYTDYYYYYYGKHPQGGHPLTTNPEAFASRASQHQQQQNHTAPHHPAGGVAVLQSNLQNNASSNPGSNFGGGPLHLNMGVATDGSSNPPNAVLGGAPQPGLAHQGGQSGGGGVVAYGSGTTSSQVGSGGGCESMPKARFPDGPGVASQQPPLNVSEQGG